ncbi:hypothetical protein [Amycolatopsis nigrescens]|uniref:hypothetical protein n=1 Tax=Amycolatopsis nigrescens TaxID=381445 RepID=UPI0012F81935|nr:hypothetical protein [Amycolatopsis nigrescens]
MRGQIAAHLRRTEGRLTAIVAAVLVAAFLAGLAGALSLRGRSERLEEMGHHRGAVNTAALTVYRALADADATSHNVVLVEGDQVTQLQQAFREDIADVTDALQFAATYAPSGDGAGKEKVADLAALVPVYVGLVEAGWVYSGQARPLGISYLNEASILVRDRMLTTAAALRETETAEIARSQDEDVDTFAWGPFAATLLLLLVLVAAQRYLARRTRRRFNLGLLAATALTVLSFALLSIVAAVAASRSGDSLHESRERVARLADARADGRSADADEARILIFPQVGDVQRLRETIDGIASVVRTVRAGSGQDDEALNAAEAAVANWRGVNEDLFSPDEPDNPEKLRPPYEDTAKGITGSAAAETLDQELGKAITAATERAEESVSGAVAALDGMDVLVVVLMALTGAAAVAGLWPRIAEYR